MYYYTQVILLVWVGVVAGGESTTTRSPSSTAAPKSTTAAPAATEGRAMVSDDTLLSALNDKRYLTRQLKCALGEGPCDPVGRKLKTYAPLVLRGSCPKCTPHETRQIQQVLSHVQRYYPKEWNKILKQFSGQ